MKILLTNDDGIEGEGLCTLASALKAAGHEVTVVAPTENNSAVSQKITMRSALRVRKTDAHSYAVDGSPADCVLVALCHLGLRPDVLLSGINAGCNLGSDVYYSGTVGAAAEGAQNGVPSIALSQRLHLEEGGETVSEKFRRAAELTVQKLSEWRKLACETDYLNVNFPACPPRGFRFCEQARSVYHNAYIETEEGLRMDISKSPECVTAGDIPLLRAGYVTVTPMMSNRTDRAVLRKWEEEA